MGRLDRLWDRLAFGTAARQVTSLSLGAAASQVLLVIGQLAIGVLYSREEFGLFSVITAIGSILAIAATGRYEMAVPLADTDEEAARLTWLCVILASVSCTGLLVLAGVAALFGTPSLVGAVGPYLWMVPFVTFGMALYTTLRMSQGRLGRFGAVARSGVWGTLAQVVVQIGGGLVGASTGTLTAGYVIGRLTSAAGMAGRARRARATEPSLPRVSPSPRRLAQDARAWRQFPLLNTWPALLNAVSASGVAPVVGAFYGLGFAGLFAYASYILAAPSALLAQAVSGVLLPRMAGREREGGDAVPSLHRTATALSYVSVAFFGSIVLLGPELFALLPPFGKWREAGTVAALLAPWLATSFVSSPLSTYATVRRRLARILGVSVVEAVLRLAALAVGLYAGGAMVGVACYSAAGVGICLYFVSWTLRLAGSSLLRWARGIRSFLVPAATILAVGLLARGADTLVVPVGLVCCAGLFALSLRGVTGLRHGGGTGL